MGMDTFVPPKFLTRGGLEPVGLGVGVASTHDGAPFKKEPAIQYPTFREPILCGGVIRLRARLTPGISDDTKPARMTRSISRGRRA
jgi:hypothetical protein